MGQNIRDFSLDHPKVRRAQRKFESRHPKAGTRVSFETLLILYRSDVSFEEVSRLIGMSSYCVGKMYPIFRPFCDGKSSFERRRSLTDKKRALRQCAVAVQETPHAQAKIVINEAQMHGCTVRLMSWYSHHDAQWQPYVRLMRINWHPCIILWAQKVFDAGPNRRSYARFFVTRSSIEKTNAVILCVAPPDTTPRFFIIPTAVILNSLFSRGGERQFINLPLGPKRNGGGTKPRFPVLDYEDAWHLLAPEQNE